MIEFQDRNNFSKYIELPKNPFLLEIGVFKGYFSDVLLKLDPHCLILIDPYWDVVTSYDDEFGIEQGKPDELYNYIATKYRNNRNVYIVRDNSEWLKSFPFDNYFDLVYIDGGHGYNDVINDLINSLRVVRSGGWISGHDYNTQEGVTRAVNDFIKANKLTIHYLAKNKSGDSYFIRKE